MPQDDGNWKYWQPIYKVDDLNVSGIISNHQISHFFDTLPTGVSKTLALKPVL